MLRTALCMISLALAGPAALAAAPAQPSNRALQASLQQLADKAKPGRMGILVLDPATGATAKVNADHPYMMMSVFKAPVAAAVLAQIEAGKLTLTQTVHLVPADVVAGSGVPSLGDRLAKGPLDVSVDELLTDAVTQSDNTAVDALVRLAGGGQVITRYLEGKGVHGMRIDVGERDFGRIFDKVGYPAVLDAKENTTTLEAAADFLRKLQAGELLSPASTQRLLAMMTAQVIPNRIRAGLPSGYSLADKTGTGATVDNRISAFNDIGIVTAPDGRRMIVAAFLRDSPANADQRNALFAELGRIVASQLQATSKP